MPKLTLTVNEVPHTLEVPGNRFLAEVLRYETTPHPVEYEEYYSV